MKRKTFAEFFEENKKEGLGNDRMFILDGRNKLSTMKEDCRKRIYQLRFVKNYKYFRICKGTFRDNIHLTGVIN